MERVILHCDINHCYAQMEERENPQLRGIAMAVGGHEADRHGIILAKNDIAKTYQIKTGETLREAYEKCPNLLVIPPRYAFYQKCAREVKEIYQRYSNQMESYGLDEAWLDVSGSRLLYGTGKQIAKSIQKEVYEEIGLTVSIGISWNKIFAKLGSDLHKQMGLVEINKHNYKEVAWSLPVQDLLYVGRKTCEKLAYFNIQTIGDLANAPYRFIQQKLGKMGEILWSFANGMDESSVALFDCGDPVKSVGNSITTPKDIVCREDAQLVFYVLCESVCTRLREQQMKGKALTISLRDIKLHAITRQCQLRVASNLCEQIMPSVMGLLDRHHNFTIPLRSIGISISSLSEANGNEQLSFFEQPNDQENIKSIEQSIDAIRQRFGHHIIKRCSMLLDRELTSFNPKEDHVIYPVSYF